MCLPGERTNHLPCRWLIALFVIISINFRSYHKTESVLKSTANATSSLFSGFSTKISQMKNSDSFKSFEERVGGAYETVKVKHPT